MSSSTRDILILTAIGLAALIVLVLWMRHVFAVSRVRRAARDAEPAVDRLEQVLRAWHERFPQPTGDRLPMPADDYPEARPRKPSTRSSSSRRRRGGYRRRRRW